MTTIAGLDVGGAHLKVALVENGTPVAAEQFVCPLWQGMDRLDAALSQAGPLIVRADRVAITMTGELSDLFPDRRSGVAALVDRLAGEFGDKSVFWMGRQGFGSAESAKTAFADVASANFLATATAAGLRTPHALLIDIGSTTTDIIPIKNGQPVPRGFTDADRLISGELVYTGLTRTALMAIADAAPFKGQTQRLCREYFATAADARRVLGSLPEGVDQHATADGRGRSVDESVGRLARMFGRDAADGTLDDWKQAASAILERQLVSILDGATQVLSASALGSEPVVVACGIGADVAAAIAGRVGMVPVSFGTLCGCDGALSLASTRVAPAVAVALLLAK